MRLLIHHLRLALLLRRRRRLRWQRWRVLPGRPSVLPLTHPHRRLALLRRLRRCLLPGRPRRHRLSLRQATLLLAWWRQRRRKRALLQHSPNGARGRRKQLPAHRRVVRAPRVRASGCGRGGHEPSARGGPGRAIGADCAPRGRMRAAAAEAGGGRGGGPTGRSRQSGALRAPRGRVLRSA